MLSTLNALLYSSSSSISTIPLVEYPRWKELLTHTSMTIYLTQLIVAKYVFHRYTLNSEINY